MPGSGAFGLEHHQRHPGLREIAQIRGGGLSLGRAERGLELGLACEVKFGHPEVGRPAAVRARPEPRQLETRHPFHFGGDGKMRLRVVTLERRRIQWMTVKKCDFDHGFYLVPTVTAGIGFGDRAGISEFYPLAFASCLASACDLSGGWIIQIFLLDFVVSALGLII